MAHYVDGFVVPVPVKNLPAYRKLAAKAGKLWMKHGALAYCECAGDDLAVKMGLSFTKGLKLKRGQTVVFAWITYRSKAHRDKVNARVMADPAMAAMGNTDMPFDCTQMMWGGFKAMVDLTAE